MTMHSMNHKSLSLNRREFVQLTTAGVTGSLLGLSTVLGAVTPAENWDPTKPLRGFGKPLRVQPVFMYQLYSRREATSWRSWGGVHTARDVDDELARISKELASVAKTAEFPLEILPMIKVNGKPDAAQLASAVHDVTLVYACTGGRDMLEAVLSAKPNNLVFVRHDSGPVYYWYEALSTSFLARGNQGSVAGGSSGTPAAHVDDVVVDDYQELLWRLRALCGVKNFLGTRIVALGGSSGKYAPQAPQLAREKYKIDIIEVSYKDFAPRIQSALADRDLMKQAARWTDAYLAIPKTRLATKKDFVVNAFVLYRLFNDLMREHDAAAFTIMNCMDTIIPMSKTTACLSLSLLNDEGWMAFCESDFVIIPAGILLRHIVGKPVFLHNSTFPHKHMVTCAHCTSPRRMDGTHYDPTQVLTHYESDYGAAPKVDFPIGQQVTFLDPEYSTGRWVGFTGIVKSNPAYEICRSQQDVEIEGHWEKLKSEARDSHWMMAYGDYLKETGYAARKIGVEWVNISET